LLSDVFVFPNGDRYGECCLNILRCKKNFCFRVGLCSF